MLPKYHTAKYTDNLVESFQILSINDACLTGSTFLAAATISADCDKNDGAEWTPLTLDNLLTDAFKCLPTIK